MGHARHVESIGDVGYTSAKDARMAEGGLLAVQGPGALDIRTGVLHGPGSTTLVTGTSSTGPMTVAIAAHHAVTSRGAANGPYLGPVLEAATTVTIAAAPGSGTRVDVVYVKQQTAAPGVPTPDVTTGPLYGVKQGSVGLGKPSLADIVGAEELATVQVDAGATSTNGSSVLITNTARQTVARGAPIPVRTVAERTALQANAHKGLQIIRLDLGNPRTETWDGSGKWRCREVGVFYATSDAGGNLVVPHSLGQVPTAWGCTVGPQDTEILTAVLAVKSSNADAAALVFRTFRTDTSIAFSTTARIHWWAEV